MDGIAANNDVMNPFCYSEIGGNLSLLCKVVVV